jgi:adenosylmethionine-8-amino-7-oxononanoate aminotransferase
MGLLFGVELTRDPNTHEPFPPEARIAARVYEDAFEAGVMTYPVQGCVDGMRGDHILFAPPFTITRAMIQTLVDALEHAVGDLEKSHLAGAGGSSALV